MKPFIFTFLIIFTFTNCNQAPKSEDKNNEDEPKVSIQDTLSQVNDTIFENEILSQEKEFYLIEDYALLDTKEKLEAKFDKSHLEDGFSVYAEGTVELPHTILTNPENGHIIKYVWKESNPNELGSIEVQYILWNEDYENTGSQKISSECGVYTGMPLKDLKAWNGKDFMFSGFGWDYAGGIFSQPNTKIYDCKTNITLGLEYDTNYDEYNFVMGDVELNTADEMVLNAPIIISDLTIYL